MPFGNAFGWPHLIVILVVILLLFGAPKLPGLAKSLGQSMRIFRKEVSTLKDEKAADERRSDVTVVEESAPVASSGSGANIPEPGPTPAQGAAAEPGSNSSQPKP
ncbi:twin-arginine translocase TatA/TatE family subunit [Lysobacter korlensis]|uniref:Sec-independent protein translocase protein TatA n=1 Tax=Lysobacter korlensis TaxID=553636 RepID=A0ABV6RWU6_9GAMM